MKQMKGNMKLWILVAAWFWLSVLMFRTEASNVDSLPMDQNGRDMIIRSVVSKNDDVSQQIAGVNNLCVDVVDGFYFDGNKIQLYPCKSNGDVNQQWTWEKKNGTIQSNGKCLVTKGTSPGSYVMIYDCNAVEANSTFWKVEEDGTILNPSSSLVLSAKSGTSGTRLTLETNVYALGQGWRFTNDSTTLPTQIVGLEGLCLQASNYIPWLEKCVENNTEQIWRFYVDGSIRLDGNQDMCLTSNGNVKGSLILLNCCSAGSSYQRWTLGDGHGTDYFPIVNLNSSFVMDVSFSNPLLHQIIIWNFHGGNNQIWHLSRS